MPFWSTAKGFVKALRNDESYRKMMAMGAGGGGFYRTAPDDIRKNLNRKDGANVLNTPKKLWDFWMRVGAASEAASRIGLFDAAKKEGVSDFEAAYRGLDLADFSRTGGFETMKFFIRTVPFMNARIQGLDKVYRGAKENPKAFMLRGGLLMAGSLALLAHNWDDERYEQLEDWDKDMNFHFWVGDEHVVLPKPFEIGALFATVPERFVRTLLGKDDTKKAGERLGRMFLDTFSMNPLPHAFMPAIEQWANKSLFTGRDIVGPSQERLLPEAQVTAGTGDLARAVGGATGTSPVRIEHLVRGYTGTLGQYALQLGDLAVRTATDGPEPPERSIEDMPVFKRFYRGGENKAARSRYLTEFYDMKREIDQTWNTVRHYSITQRGEAAKDLYQAKIGTQALRQQFGQAGRSLSEINRAMNSTRVDRRMGGGEKRRLINKYGKLKNQIAGDMMKNAPAMTKLIVEANAIKGEARERAR